MNIRVAIALNELIFTVFGTRYVISSTTAIPANTKKSKSNEAKENCLPSTSQK